MKNKAPLTIIELTVMLLVFALAAALCLRAFLWADRESKNIVKLDQAVMQAQTAAELLKSCQGNLDLLVAAAGGVATDTDWVLHYDGQWRPTTIDSTYELRITLHPDNSEFLGTASVNVYQDNQCLTSLLAAWQKEVPHA